MELAERLGASDNNTDYLSPFYRPKSYKDMDGWLNELPSKAWLGLLGAYAAGGFANVSAYIKQVYVFNFEKWADKDLRHFFNSRNWSDFKNRFERRMT